MNTISRSPLENKEGVLQALVEEIRISEHADGLARDRYDALGRWLDRPNSTLHGLQPVIYPQGSFLLGTAIRPVGDGDAYDVDLVVVLEEASPWRFTQASLKELVGKEIKAYAKEKGLKAEPERKRRCWTLEYADAARFHLDILPALPASRDQIVQKLGLEGTRLFEANRGSLDKTVIAITDENENGFHDPRSQWPLSNPKGFGEWFRLTQEGYLKEHIDSGSLLRDGRAKAEVEYVPLHEVLTPLQATIMLLKRHRDAMFDGDDDKPISVIITTLAGEAYRGARSIEATLSQVLPAMRLRVANLEPDAQILNPSLPNENFADKWGETPRKRSHFETWIEQANQDFLGYLSENGLRPSPGLEARITKTTMDKIVARLPFSASPVSRLPAAARNEAEKVKADGRQTRPWFSKQ